MDTGPELGGLLFELAEHPERVGRLGKHIALADLLNQEPWDTEFLHRSDSYRWTAGEEHLLRAHRDEVARLLLQASLRARYFPGIPLLSVRDAEGELVKIDDGEWRGRARHILHVAKRQDRFVDLLKSLLDPEGVVRASPRDLAEASMALVPRTEAIVCCATRAYDDGDLRVAERLLRRALGGNPSAFLASLACQNLAAVAMKQLRFQDAIEWARQGVEADPVRASVSWLAASTQAGHASEILDAAAALGAASSRAPDQVDEYRQFLLQSRRLGAWSPTKQAYSYSMRVHKGLTASTERILEVFA
jgi:tetratricopeptide (TPR) repeat protein